MLIVGGNEAETASVSVRSRKEGENLGSMKLTDFLAMAEEEIRTKKR